MGNLCTRSPTAPILTVTYLPNSIPQDKKYKAIDSQSIRLCDVTAYKKQRNLYQFTMAIRNQIEDIHQTIPILNELIHCIGYQNYELQLQNKIIVDIFDKKLQNTLVNVQNPKTMRQYSMKIVTFNSYTHIKFKKALYQLYINHKLGVTNRNCYTVKLLDYFVYGVNPNQQVFVFLFDKCVTSLANIAQYRKLANNPWLQKQKIKIIYEIFESYQHIHNRHIIHRDIRPSNVFYVAQLGQFAIGNFSRARYFTNTQVKGHNPYTADLMSVCGVPDFSYPQMQKLMKQGQHIGFYDGLQQDYHGLKSIINIIQTCQIYDKNPIYINTQITHLVQMLNNNIPYRDIMLYLQNIVNKYQINVDNNSNKNEIEVRDQQIANTCAYLLGHTHKALIQQYSFLIYGVLGYNKNYTDKAHVMLNYNNQNGKQYENAPILLKLGDFYQQKGAKGTQYYYNAFILFIQRAQNQIRYGYPDRAQNQLHNAKQTYFKFNRNIQSQVPRIQINRIQALLQLQNKNYDNAKNIITENLVRAAKSNILVEKQCKILLAFGKIYRRVKDGQDQGLKKLTTGLNICQNSAVFESPSSCRIMKSKFCRELGCFYSNKLKINAFMKKMLNASSDQNQIQIKAQGQTYLKSALQIQQRQAVDDLEVADTLEELGNFYYIQRNFYDAKRYLQAAKIRLAHIKQLVNPQRQLYVLYTLGSCNYYLQQYNQAKINYMTCLAALQKFPKTQNNQILNYNLQGNYALALLRLGNQSGKKLIEDALQHLKARKTQNSYDYASLYKNYQKCMQEISEGL